LKTIDKIQLPFKIQKVPTYTTDLVIIGDLIREAAAHEVALKIYETCYLPVRSFGLEHFLHGPKVTIDKQTSILAFTSVMKSRKESLINYAEAIGSEVIEINENTPGLNDIPYEFAWLTQLLYGQYLALELSRKLGTDPDSVRTDQSPYKEARRLVNL
jgi:fructoselysine-6-P-deglycase FrlB-like protein